MLFRSCFQAAVLLLSAVVSFFDVCGQAHLLAVVVRRACALDWVVSLASLSGVCLGCCCRHCSLVLLGGLVLLDLIFFCVYLVWLHFVCRFVDLGFSFML